MSKVYPKEVLVRYVANYVFPDFDNKIRRIMKSLGYHFRKGTYQFPEKHRNMVFIKNEEEVNEKEGKRRDFRQAD